MPRLFINLTTAQEDPDRTTVAFVVANAGVAAGEEVVIFLNVEAVRLVTPGYADAIALEGFKPLRELRASFVENGGKLWICQPCFHARGFDKDNLIAGTSCAAVVKFLGQGAASLSY